MDTLHIIVKYNGLHVYDLPSSYSQNSFCKSKLRLRLSICWFQVPLHTRLFWVIHFSVICLPGQAPKRWS